HSSDSHGPALPYPLVYYKDPYFRVVSLLLGNAAAFSLSVCLYAGSRRMLARDRLFSCLISLMPYPVAMVTGTKLARFTYAVHRTQSSSDSVRYPAWSRITGWLEPVFGPPVISSAARHKFN
ncbi:hypothetical protein BOX15_Mlig010202g2, partial [Macrostomum lignano]